ncbi:IS607 family element RNA-guided endonuclease TnpB [Nocardia huaxiensis]|uniref:IS607 family element RNA-guided endonuclease TnpB n=1 Tax=Nocardia huaxiensis TaxID=2755382 RepID=UPI001E4BFAE0|nr:IS607 family element RNA-guided endonuclease TnpB [Nocardia huaxiensis]UFS99749.1 IS607 family element RNA-guided endonuclease TnpB [Nocardia huaxiensis]
MAFQRRPNCIIHAYRFALDPNASQQAALQSHCGAARAAYNWAVQWVSASWWQRQAERSYGIDEAELTPWRAWSLPELRREFNQVKRSDPRFSSWWQENSKEAYNTGLANAAAAFDNYAKSKSGQRAGHVGLPRFKPKHRTPPSCTFTTGAIRIDPDRRHVTLPRLGSIRTHESTRKLQRRIALGTARILSATVRFDRGRWWVSFKVEVERGAECTGDRGVAGVDLGVRNLAVVADSDGQVRCVPNPRNYERGLTVLKRHSRRVSRRHGPDHRTGRQPSKRWLKASAERNRVHHRIANLRTDALHKLTTSIRAEYATVVVEDLNVAGMLRNRRLARRIADAGFGTIRHQLTYKREWSGGRTIVADRWYPSSKTCSCCGAVKAKLPLRIRMFSCDTCGLVMDRDENAARNLAALAAACDSTGTGVAGDRGASAPKPRGANQKTHHAHPARTGGTRRAGGRTPRERTEARDRHQDTAPNEAGGAPVTDLPRRKAGDIDSNLPRIDNGGSSVGSRPATTQPHDSAGGVGFVVGGRPC